MIIIHGFWGKKIDRHPRVMIGSLIPFGQGELTTEACFRSCYLLTKKRQPMKTPKLGQESARRKQKKKSLANTGFV